MSLCVYARCLRRLGKGLDSMELESQVAVRWAVCCLLKVGQLSPRNKTERWQREFSSGEAVKCCQLPCLRKKYSASKHTLTPDTLTEGGSLFNRHFHLKVRQCAVSSLDFLGFQIFFYPYFVVFIFHGDLLNKHSVPCNHALVIDSIFACNCF